MEITQKEKAARLQRAVINSSVEELSEIYDELGYVEMSAPALGLACRFRGLAVVELLVQKGATFDFPSTKEVEEAYGCYRGTKKGDFRTNYSLYLLKVFGKHMPIYSLSGMAMEQHTTREDGSLLPFLSDKERADVLKYLLENREKTAFFAEELLYYSIFYRDTALVNEFKRQNVRIPEKRIHIIADGASTSGWCWKEYVHLTKQLANEDYIEVMQQFVSEIDGRPLYYTEGLFDETKKRFCDGRIFAFFMEHFKQEKMNKYAILCALIDEGALEAFPVMEQAGWLAAPKRRDEMIVYASEKGQTEIAAWLLDYKNRTADIAAEQAKAEKKLMRELNRAPDSVEALRKLWSYRKQEDDTLCIVNYKGTDTEVTVPEKIGKRTVTAVAEGAFMKNSHFDTIIKITLPQTLQYIGSSVFCQMQKLEDVNIPDGVREIGDRAFMDCDSLRNITIPDSVKSIGTSAFEGSSLLERITLPGQLKAMGRAVFKDCSSLEQVTIPEGMKVIGTAIFENCSSLRSVTIPGTVREISASAFFRCEHLEQVTICAGVRKIGHSAFGVCGSLTHITIPDTVEEIGHAAFMSCGSLTHITIPDTVEKIGSAAFGWCCQLETVRIGEGVKEIGDRAFINCAALKNIRIPAAVEKIDTYAFSGCQELAEISLGEAVKEIGAYAFQNCSALCAVTLPAAVKSVGDYAFQGCALLKSITLPAAVEEIGKGAFAGCTSLEEVRICGEVKKIGAEVFADCPNLKRITIHQSIPNRILGETFAQVPGLTVFCPKGSKTEAYCRKKGILYINCDSE